MQRLFHAKIQFQSWVLLIAVLFVFAYSAWHKQPIILLLSLILLIVMIDRMIHTTYTISDTHLIIHTGKFSKDQLIPLENLIRLEKISGSVSLASPSTPSSYSPIKRKALRNPKPSFLKTKTTS